MSFLSRIFGDPNKKILKKLEEQVVFVNDQEIELQKLSDGELKQKAEKCKERIKNGQEINDLLPEVFALVREASRRTLKMRHFDVQIIGGIVLHQGKIAEMKTGEGKTLAATLAVVLNAFSHPGVHVVTVNEYLAKRDAEWMGKIYDFLGLKVSVTLHGQTQEEKKSAYQSDIIYGTNNEFGFDYLRDNMVQDISDMVQGDLNYAIVDEVDSILIDEARTPLIISAPAEESTDEYYHFAKIVSGLEENKHYNVDEKLKASTLTEEGISRVEKALGVSNIYEIKGIRTVHHVEQALKARTLFEKDRDYVVKNNEVVIVDEFTGRLMPGRRYSEGLHQAIEAKENVSIKRESMTLATITFQNYFRLYKKLAGMTGTALTEAEEFSKIYKLDVVEIPTNKPNVRNDHNDQIFKTELGKYKAVVAKIKELNQKGQPVLVGTSSIEKNERLSELLTREGISHNVLNAKNHEKEAEIIAQAGKLGAVTVATNMAGRGVDIVLGGNPPDKNESETVKNIGGLYVIGTERHEARRIDNQLRGRSGRQGDLGASSFYVSTEDDLLRLFGSDRMKLILDTMNIPDNVPIEHKLISKSLESAQKRVEGHNFDIRKHLVEYDDVMNKHREVIYARRKKVLKAWQEEKKCLEAKVKSESVKETKGELKQIVLSMIFKEITQVVSRHAAKEEKSNFDLEEIVETMKTIFQFKENLRERLAELTLGIDEEGNGAKTRTKIIDYLEKFAKEAYQAKEEKIKPELMRQIEKLIVLQAIDKLWIEHLEDMKALRESVGLRGYGQKDPLIEYKRESFKLFQGLLDSIQNQVVYSIYKVGVAVREDTPMKKENMQLMGADKGEVSRKEPIRKKKEIGRNEPCFCGSGKKFKKCHGK